MKTINTLALMFTIALASVASAQDGEQESVQNAKQEPAIKIVKETNIFLLDKARDIGQSRGVVHSMRLSPDGKTLLYIKKIPQKKNKRSGYRLAILDIKTGKETVMPGAPISSNDFLIAYVATQPFDATGKNIVFPIGISKNDRPIALGRDKIGLGIYNIATGKVKKLALTAFVIFPTYDAKGKNLIVLEMFMGKAGGPDLALSKIVISPVDKIKFRKIGAMGMPRSPCPSGDVLPVLLLPTPNTTKSKLLLHNTKSDKKLATMPLDSGIIPEECYPQWTPDGRYFYYVDCENDKAPDGNPRPKRVMRIWDQKKSVEHSLVDGMVPIGPAPGKTGMIVLNNRINAYLIHDPVTSKLSPILDGSTGARIISVTGKFLVCLKNDNGVRTVYRAEIK
jgi:hypothetical protein